jgi:hypothetical protein
MDSNQRRMIQIAVIVTGFAVGMAGLLNYFKYRAVADRLVTERLTFTGKQIENSIQASIALGLQFSELGTMPGTLARLRATDDLIQGIDIFDADGRTLYSTDQLRTDRPVPSSWLAEAGRSGNADWVVRDSRDSAVGQAIQSQYGATVGHVAMRFANERLQDNARSVAQTLAIYSLVVFGVAALLASLATSFVLRRLDRDASRLEAALRSGDPARAAATGGTGGFAAALRRFIDTTRGAETQLIMLRAQLQKGDRP